MACLLQKFPSGAYRRIYKSNEKVGALRANSEESLRELHMIFSISACPIPGNRRSRDESHLPRVIFTAGLVGQASAATIYWTNWTSAVLGKTAGSAQGTINPPSGPITVTYSGEVASETTINNTYPSWLPASSYTGGDVGNAPPAGDIVAQNGGAGTGVNTITFSQPINNPVMAIWSLGSPGIVTQYVFPASEQVNIEGGGPSNEYGGSAIHLVTGTNAITGNEGNGVIEFEGNYSSITFTNPVAETWYGFTLGVAGLAVPPTPTSAPEPATFALIAISLAMLGVTRRKRAAGVAAPTRD